MLTRVMISPFSNLKPYRGEGRHGGWVFPTPTLVASLISQCRNRIRISDRAPPNVRLFVELSLSKLSELAPVLIASRVAFASLLDRRNEVERVKDVAVEHFVQEVAEHRSRRLLVHGGC